jgi:hypothetical protein
MNRFAIALALAGVALLPDTASAFFFRCGGPPPAPYYGYRIIPLYRPYVVPLYSGPVVPAVPVGPPQIVPVIPPASAPKVVAPVARPAPQITITPVKPAEVDPMVRPAANEIPRTTIPDPMVPKVPPMTPPAPLPTSDDKAKLPPIVLPEIPEKPKAADAPAAKPMAAPSPMDVLPLIPTPDTKKTPGDKDELPPIVLPPERPGSPSGVVPPVGPTTSKSSPLTGAVKVQVITAAGATATGNLRKIGFFNHSTRDLDLVIEGKAVKLPKKSYLNAELPPKFTWKAADGEALSTTVPDGSPGVDLVFKD